MTTPASIKKHPVHPMLVPFPIGLWIFSLICDVIYAFQWGGALWKDIAFVSMVGGVLGALLAAVAGYLDYRSITAPEVRRIGWWHMILNLSVTVLFAINLWLRAVTGMEAVLPVLLSLVGVSLLGISGWLGGELVYVHGVAVEPQTKPSRGRERNYAA
ncbi:MAG TPA: DUF2231 domain-containing protein [Nitrospira sp.]|nr:DUF2231 domain-containing protein [Nitrospira sp.]